MDSTLAYILLSIKPQFAELILSGRKSVELRKLFSTDAAGKKMFLYSTKPRQIIIGAVDIIDVKIQPVNEILEELLDKCCINHLQLKEYFGLNKNGYVIHLQNPVRFNTKITLKEMRIMQLSPPQSYMFIDESSDIHETLKKLLEDNQNNNAWQDNCLFDL